MREHVRSRLTKMVCQQSGETWVCVCNCGFSTTTNSPEAWHGCETRPDAAAGSQPNGLSIFQKAANFATSAARHVSAGMPQASEEEVARRFAICETCEHFDGRACKKCGCPVVREKKFLSKLSWANEKCPVGKW